MKTIIALAATMLIALPAFAADKKQKNGEEIARNALSRLEAGRDTISAAYRQDIAKAVKFADKIEVFMLDFQVSKDPPPWSRFRTHKEDFSDQFIEIRPYEVKTKVLKLAAVPAKDLPKWIAATHKLVASTKDGVQAGCHFPIHGIRVSCKDSVLFETSFCWQCSNYFFDYGGEARWHGLTGDTADLEKLLKEFMPIPAEELERFEKAYPTKRSEPQK